MEFYKIAEKVFELDEGKRNKPYLDSKGLWTIGIGHLIGDRLENFHLDDQIIKLLFQLDLAISVRAAHNILGMPFFFKLSPARQMAIVSMLFTLGEHKFSTQFGETIAAIKNEDWDNVAERILKTKWARDVDPKQRANFGRDDRISYMFKTGEFHKDYNV